jgi:DNA-binding Xre family transcriptional regulator
MSVRRGYQKAERTPEQLAELRAVRERSQREKPSPEEALAQSGHDQLVPLGEVILLHQVLALLKQERERQQLTLADLEERIGISQAALSRLETGRAANPTIDTIYRISAALGKMVGCYLQDAPALPRRRIAGAV